MDTAQTFGNNNTNSDASQKTALSTPIDQRVNQFPESNTARFVSEEVVSTPEVQTPSIQVSTPPPAQNELPQSSPQSRGSKLLKILIFAMLFILLGAFMGTYAVAYEKIKLTKYPELQAKVSYLVMSIPLMPKTPKFLIEKTVLTHQSVTKQSFDISLVINSNELSSLLGLNSLDFQVKGNLDYSDPKDIVFNLNTFLSKDFNLELKKKDAFLYFKINKLPSFLFSALGISQGNLDPLLNKWVSYDTTPLDTEARKQMQQMQDNEVNPLSKDFNNLIDEYIDSKVLEKVKLEMTVEDGNQVYKLTLDADPGLIDYMGNKVQEKSQRYGFYDKESQNTPKLSETLKNLKWEMFIDQKQYFTRKVVVNMKLEYDGTSYGLNSYLGTPSVSPNLDKKTEIMTTFAAKFDDFGKNISVEAPESSITFEEFTNIISEMTRGMYASTQASVRNAKRKSDTEMISKLLESYKVDCGKYPSTLKVLTEQPADSCSKGPYLTQLPEDPIGIEYYYQVSQNGKKFDLCAFLEETESTQNTCPNLIYNYHLTNQ